MHWLFDACSQRGRENRVKINFQLILEFLGFFLLLGKEGQEICNQKVKPKLLKKDEQLAYFKLHLDMNLLNAFILLLVELLYIRGDCK